MIGQTARILSCDWSQVRSQQMMQSISQVTLAAGHLTELGEGPVGSFIEVRECQSVSLVSPESLHPAQHPVVVFALLGLADVSGGPALVPGAPRLPLPGADRGVSLQ